MIHYDLRCGDGHTFDGWFRNSTAFDHQAAAGLLDCPVCASTAVTRALMAPRLSRGAKAPPIDTAAPAEKAVSAEVAVAEKPPDPPAAAMDLGGAPAMPDQVRAVLQRIRAEVEHKCHYVGPRFADEARSMHNGEQPHRPIYGETTPDQADALAEDGINVARIPWVPRSDG